ncbi:MAG: hypothetical protein JWO38_6496 [Gemmataceae bacterium]|nr:hypothetical protein [Gemmataceae bacterium]
MIRRTLKLVERQTRELGLPQDDAAFLLAHARNVIEVQPGFTSGSFRLTARGHVGFLDGPTVRFEILPKIPWPNLFLILGLDSGSAPPGGRVEPGGGLLAVLCRELTDRLRDVLRSGPVRGYREDDRESPFLRGRLRTADQLRDAAARAFPDHFHVTETAFDLDTPWNRIPKAVSSALLARSDLPSGVRSELAAAVVPLEAVPVRPVTGADFEAAAREPRAAAYNGVLSLCQLIRDGFASTDLTAGGTGAFLVDLGRAFEDYLAASIRAAFVDRPTWSVEAQPRFVLGRVRGEPVVLQPDVLVRRRGIALAVLDAKWKRPGPDAADLHQILSYASVTGARHVGLVYPGRRPGRRVLQIDGGRVRVSLLRLQVVGPADACRASANRLARVVSRAGGR